MKNRSIRLRKLPFPSLPGFGTLLKTLAIGGCLCCSCLGAYAQIEAVTGDRQPAISENSHVQRLDELDDLSFIEMINSVELDAKSADLIRKFQEKEGRNRLHNKEYNSKNGCSVETYRNKEVLLISIPASRLFSPNDVELTVSADALLSPLKRYLKDPDMYRVLLVMHTDNTGSDQYRDHLTEERAGAVFDWFVNHGVDTRYLFPYAMGDDMPLYNNDTMDHRERNRRLEVYLVPGKKMLEQAKKGRIVF